MRRLTLAAALAALATCAAPAARADVKPHALFSDGMVLQQGVACPVWGTADRGEEFSVILQVGPEKVGSGGIRADKDGRWRYDLPKAAPGGPYTLTIGNAKKSVTLKDVYVGEVWVCSGQSNMEWSVSASADAGAVIKASANPKIRLFKVANGPAMTPQHDAKGAWRECGPGTVGNFSAVGYHFGRALQEKLGVPVGLIQTAWGGTPAEVWTSRKVLEADPRLRPVVDHFEQRIKDYPRQLEAFQEQVKRHKEAAEKAKAEGKAPPPAPRRPDDPKTFPYNSPFLLYNARVATLIPYAIRGVIWYQGESNAFAREKSAEYATLFPAMIKNWRDDWGQGEFPFLFVQLAPFMKIEKQPTDPPWALLREAQRRASFDVPKAAMAVITDVGDEKDIHPKKKQPVGERLALAARAVAYGAKVNYTGPVYERMNVEGDKAVLTFKSTGGGLEAHGGALEGFTVAGSDGKFYPARAEIRGDTVVVSSDKVVAPAAVRFGWANYPVVNLWGKDGLPASPFTTEDWGALTAARAEGK
jgi:sialate O-acetylesterase